mmetsp:Transcript_23703/g.60296  ORF Transcript_23703/g.60296 Transcript_23703/m.60296 type:complete len:306 (+) Transcript_23703:55-972(+)|eukprot:CAMPEP_0183536084 /NCGR_PEP_ID=MMETSP0371-20130417/27995_1 /TAXON_ID=268820 /ORGANISM="Peridinium aciculiferum, Strain PAER-2" /LENGTH=305 /DNA_ID=CAMNT_0025736639 /DNA_START=58 /DNA_END=975 /DNA_ORIENTATION=+
MGTLCSSGGGGAAGGGGALVDDEEILFVGRRAAEGQVSLRRGVGGGGVGCGTLAEAAAAAAAEAADSDEPGGEPADSGDALAFVRVTTTTVDRERQRAKAAVAELIRSLVKGRSVVVSGVEVGTQDCMAMLDRELTHLTLSDKVSGKVLLQIPLGAVIQVSPEAHPGAARYPFGECSARMLLERRGDVVLQLDSREECDAFVSSVRACSRHLRSLSSAPSSTRASSSSASSVVCSAPDPAGKPLFQQLLPSREPDEESVPSTVVRAVVAMRDTLGLASLLSGVNPPRSSSPVKRGGPVKLGAAGL